MSKQVYQIITDKIISLLENGTIPWPQPWKNAPKNHVSKKAYRGLNIFMLNAIAISEGYKTNNWVSYKQAQELGGNVKKGEHGSMVVFWKWINKSDGEMFPVLRYYTVFNLDQCENIDIPTTAGEIFTQLKKQIKLSMSRLHPGN